MPADPSPSVEPHNAPVHSSTGRAPGQPTDSTDPLQPILLQAGVTLTDVGVDELRRIWITVGGDPQRFDDFADAVARACSAATQDAPTEAEELGLRLGRWRIDLTREGIRTALLSAVVAGLLVDRGLTEVSIALVTAVLPSVLNIERIQLSKGDQRLLIDLRAKPALRTGFATEDELYRSLPADTRDKVNRYDFADFIQRLREAGLIDEGDDDWLRTRDPDDPRPWIRLL
jgi:hypothetical protein